MSDNDRKSLLRIAAGALVRAPRRSKLALLANVVLICGVAAANLMETHPEETAFHYVGLGLVLGGALLLSVATVLWTLSQEGGSCNFFVLKREALMLRGLRIKKLDEVLIVFPVLAFLAGCMIAAGLAIGITTLTRLGPRLALAFMGVWFLGWTISMITSTSRFLYSHAREQADAAARARGQATEAQLAALQAQMNPHFLFNTLNTVASLVRTDSAAAEATVENLAVVLRRTLDRSRDVLSTVDDEIDHLAAYLSVAKQRFEDRLQVHWAVDPRARDLLLPTMTLQPLVENALKHGLGARLEGGALHIGIQLEEVPPIDEQRASGKRSSSSGGAAATEPVATGKGWRLVLEVADDGPGFPRRHLEGTGLSNLRTRLATLYGDAAELAIDRDAPGARVIIKLPVVRSAREVLGEIVDAATVPAAVEPT